MNHVVLGESIACHRFSFLKSVVRVDEIVKPIFPPLQVVLRFVRVWVGFSSPPPPARLSVRQLVENVHFKTPLPDMKETRVSPLISLVLKIASVDAPNHQLCPESS